ncbi:MAG: hypothetical protein RIT07_506 [Bacteroidota bacterium]
MLRVGITGGIGSGKTTVCRVFETLGVPVYYADAEAKKLYAENSELKNRLVAVFGPAIISQGAVNTARLAEIAFASPENIAQINAIVHPYVFEHYENWCGEHDNHPYTLKEAAILFESGSYKRVQKTIGVIAPESERVSRVMLRDGCSKEEVIKRMSRQMPQDALASRCDFLIQNNNQHSIIEQVLEIHRQLLTLSEADVPFVQ